jgi:hypothetical protein
LAVGSGSVAEQSDVCDDEKRRKVSFSTLWERTFFYKRSNHGVIWQRKHWGRLAVFQRDRVADMDKVY